MKTKPEVYFYHLTHDSFENALASLLSLARKAGWRVLLCEQNEDRLIWLDEALWIKPKESFLPHARAGGKYDAEQPVLLSQKIENGNGAHCLMMMGGNDFILEQIADFVRVCVIFDDKDEDILKKVRAQWKMLTDAEIYSIYWRQENGTWQKKSEYLPPT